MTVLNGSAAASPASPASSASWFRVSAPSTLLSSASTTSSAAIQPHPVPLLQIQTTDPYRAGWVHGFYLHRPIHDLFVRWKVIRGGLPTYAATRAQVHIPDRFRAELQGLVDGYNQARGHATTGRRRGGGTAMTWEDAYGWHALADYQTEPHGRKQCAAVAVAATATATAARPSSEALACFAFVTGGQCAVTAHLADVAARGSYDHAEWPETHWPVSAARVARAVSDAGPLGEECVVARNMDWPSYGALASGTFVLVYPAAPAEGRHSIALVTYPGVLGGISGVNQPGFTLNLNTCLAPLHSGGIPTLWAHRMLLEQSASVPDAMRLLLEPTSAAEATLTFRSACHLLLADSNDTYQVVHINQGPFASAPTAAHLWPATCFQANFSFKTTDVADVADAGNTTDRVPLRATVDRFCSELRRQTWMSARTKTHLSPDAILAMLPINNHMTCHSLMFWPRQRKLAIGFDNGFAADQPRLMCEY